MIFNGIANRLFNRSKTGKKKESNNIINLRKFQSYISGLDIVDHYVSRREYMPVINQYADTISFLRKLEEDNILEEYCGKYSYDYRTALRLINQYGNIENLVTCINEEFISRKMIDEKCYLDNILEDIDPVIQLDDEQRQVVLSDEDYSLVIAGAGAGKTTTIAAKVKYLVERKNVDAEKILVISFTNKAVNELREKINKNLNIACPIATFHSTGNAILHKSNPEKMNIVESTKFTKFEEKMGYAKLMKITRTYRNSQEIIDIAGNFIQKNSTQIKKSLISQKHIDEPAIIYTYDDKKKYNPDDRRSGQYYAVAYAVVTAIEKIIEFDNVAHVDTSKSKILLLGRFNFDGNNLAKTGMFEYRRKGSKLTCVKYPKLDITFMTAHASKGLGYDNVIVVNGRNERYGFPSKIEDDPVLSLVVREDRSIQYAEERRLFYVAMTRTKNRVYFVAPEQNPSEFLLEIKREYKNVYLNGEWNENQPQNLEKKTCPICGYPLQLKYKVAYGLRLYICTNEPEICSFMTNDIRGGKLSIMKCSDCRDGYLVVKSNKKDGKCFLGCTNYKQNGRGRNKAISAQDYYKLMEYDTEELRNHVNTMFPSLNPSRTGLKQTRATSDVSSMNWEMQVMNESDNVEVVADKFGQYAGMNIFDVVEMIIRCLVEISDKRYFGKTILINTLMGKENSKIVGYKLNELSEFGGLSEMNREDIKIIVEWLIDRHYICVVGEKYPVLHITSDGLSYKKKLTPEKMRSLVNILNEKRGD